MSKMLDSIQMICRAELPPPPVARLIGITMASAELGRVVMEMKVGLVECDIHDEEDRLVARASSTCMALKGEQRAGR